jgi:hypothetical protein
MFDRDIGTAGIFPDGTARRPGLKVRQTARNTPSAAGRRTPGSRGSPGRSQSV